MAKDDRVEACMDVLFAIAMDGSAAGSIRVAAISRILDREIGRPATTNPNMKKDDVSALSDDELRAELARIEREEAAAEARATGQVAAG